MRFNFSKKKRSKNYNMATIAVFSSKQQMSLVMKDMVSISLTESPSPRILFPTGTTPLGEDGFFAALQTSRQVESLETERIRLVSGDEYHGVCIDDPGSFATYLRTKVIEPLGMDIQSSHVLNGNAQDSMTHCHEFEENLRLDPCSMAVLGLGTNGHVAFNDPPSTLHSVTRCLDLTEGSVAASQNDFPDRRQDELPTKALTVGLSTLTSHSRVCCVLVTGAHKAGIVQRVLEQGECSPNIPASQLRDATNFVFCLDDDAASELSPTTLTGGTCWNFQGEDDSVKIAKILFSQTSRVIVNGDVGGTNARMQLWDVLGSGTTLLRHDKRYQANDFSSGGDLIEFFLNDGTMRSKEEKVDALCLAVCGPVSNENEQSGVVLPNQGPTGWGLNMSTLLAGRLNARVTRGKLLNDFVAVGLGVTGMKDSQLVTLHEARLGSDPNGTMAAVGAGTGLGAVFMTRDPTKGHYLAHPSEGGMCEFSALTEKQWQLRRFCKKNDPSGHCTVEAVISGPGLVNIYNFCNSLKNDGEKSSVLDGVGEERDSPSKIIEGVGNKDEICCETLDLFIECLAAHLRTTAMHMLPTGGMFICGGIPCRPVVLDRIKELLSPGLFVEDPVMGSFLRDRISLFLIANGDCGLLGARIRAEMLLRES